MSKKKKYNRFSQRNLWGNKRVTPKGYRMIVWHQGRSN